MEEVTKTKGVEIARLTAQLRKAEMMVTSLERQVDQKVGRQKSLCKIDVIKKFCKISFDNLPSFRRGRTRN